MTELSENREHTTRRRRVIPIHPLLFAAFPIVALYARNLDQVTLLEVLPQLASVLVGTLALWAVLCLLTRHIRKAAAASSALVLVFFSYGHLLGVTPRALHGFIAPVCFLTIAPILYALFRTRKPLLDATAVLNAAAIVLLAPSCWAVGAGFWRAWRPGAHIGERVASVSPIDKKRAAITRRRRVLRAPSMKVADLPDVYYIILDAYGRADSLKMFYGFDNTPFLRELEKRGFYIAERSHANYDETPLCLASALNLTYLDEVAKKVGPSASLEACRQMLDDNEVAIHLSKLGYHYVSIGSGVGQAKVETADLLLNDQPDVSLFEGQALNLTRPGVMDAEEFHRYDRHRSRLNGVFDNLDTVARLHYPKFVFAHVLAPHPPFVFGPNGEAVYPRGQLNFADASWLLQQITREQYITGYTGQLQYINRRTLEAVDALLKQSRRPPIIIIQGDHGSRMNLDWDSLDKTDVREPFSILNAYYVPRKVRDDLYATISPVNSFRIVLNDVFGANYARLPDRSYYSTANEPFKFTDVTDLLARSKMLLSASHSASPAIHPPRAAAR